MKINIKATNISLTSSITEYIEKKLSMLEKFFKNTDDVLINIEVGKTTKHHKSGDVFKAEINILKNGENFYEIVETEDLYAAIDEVKDLISYRLSSDKKRVLHLVRRGALKIKNWLKFGKKTE